MTLLQYTDINHSGECKPERCSGAASKLQKAFRGPKMSASAPDAISNCVQLLYLGLYGLVQNLEAVLARWQLTALSQIP